MMTESPNHITNHLLRSAVTAEEIKTIMQGFCSKDFRYDVQHLPMNGLDAAEYAREMWGFGEFELTYHILYKQILPKLSNRETNTLQQPFTSDSLSFILLEGGKISFESPLYTHRSSHGDRVHSQIYAFA